MAKSKVTEEQIVEVLRDPQYTSERQRCLALGIMLGGFNMKRFDEIRQKYGIPKPEPGKGGKPRSLKAESALAPLLKFDDIQKGNRLIWRKKRLIVLSRNDEEIRLRRMDGSEYKLSRKQFEEGAAEYSLVPPEDLQCGPVKTYIDPSLKDRKESMDNPLPETIKPMTEDEHRQAHRIPECYVPGRPRRDYLDKISRLLDLMMPECRKNPLLRVDVKSIAKSIFDAGFEEELKEAGPVNVG